MGHDLSLNGEVDLVNKLVRADIEAGSISFDTLENLSKSDSGHSDNNAHITLDSEWAADVTLQVDWSGQYGLATQQFESGSGSTNFTDGELVGINLSQQVCDIANKIMTLPISQGDFSQATRLNRLTTDLELIESSMSFPIYSWTQTP